jgi:ABC-type antimicrobial peptide transport system permease subunit
MGRQSRSWKNWDDKPSGADDIEIEIFYISKQYFNFYELQLIDGEMLNENDARKNVLINESAVKAFGWEHPVGKTFSGINVKGVIKNVYNFSPIVPVKPSMYMINLENYNNVSFILFKYQEGKWDVSKNKIEQFLKEKYPDQHYNFKNTEETYDEFFQSENALLKLLSLVSLVCIIISIFGFFSLISLSCEERRKEIAIRKINGATLLDILNLFFKTYFPLLIIGAAIAFPIAYFIMKQWIEKYVRQTDISAWIYITILLVMASIIVLCVGWRIYKASVENPAEVVKTE